MPVAVRPAAARPIRLMCFVDMLIAPVAQGAGSLPAPSDLQRRERTWVNAVKDLPWAWHTRFLDGPYNSSYGTLNRRLPARVGTYSNRTRSGTVTRLRIGIVPTMTARDTSSPAARVR
ncbi:hypothetical protein GCM10010532_106670 [Dactylosporangium siamense]|uniref:Transposase n=1 Tax=Dactylosporangium siamense TaxID=685454 RepID=A0A919Q0L1_9ACTN|nr:hypothetical protein Dsi01nite_101890 [Dactylosporangium siamense]